MEINTRLSGAPLPPLCTSFLHIYDCYSVCFPDLFPLPFSPSIYLPYQPLYDDLNYIILCVLYLKSHTSRTQQQFVDDVDKRQTAASCTN